MKKIFSFLALILLISIGAKAYAGSVAASEPQDGESYYIYNVETGQFLSRGASWGTQAIGNDYGMPWQVSVADGKYTLRMLDLVKAGNNEGLGDNAFTDNGSPVAFVAEGNATNGYILTCNGNKLSLNADNTAGYANTTACTWQFLTASQWATVQAAKTDAQYESIILSSMIDATPSTISTVLAAEGVTATDMSSAIPFPTNSNWSPSKNGSRGGNQNGGDYGVESYQTGDAKYTYTATGLAQGLYKVGIRAMQRSASNAACYAVGEAGFTASNAYFDANGYRVQIKDWYSSCTSVSDPNSTGAFVNIANNGGYYSEVYTFVGADGKLTLTAAAPSYWGSCWFLFNGITLTYYEGYAKAVSNEMVEALLATVPTTPMDAQIKATLDNAISAINSSKTEANYLALKNAIDAAQVSADFYAQFVSLNTASAKLDAAGQAAYASTLAAYNNGTLTTYEAAFAAYQAAIRAQTTSGADMTGAIVNPNFDGNINGWTDTYTNGNHGYQNNKRYENGDFFVDQFMECWTPSNGSLANGKLSQVITDLPEGEYTMSADLISCRQEQETLELTGVYIFAQSDVLFKSEACATANVKPEKFSFDFKMTGDQVEIGLMTESTNCNWVAFDNVTLTYNGPLKGNIFQDELVEALKKYTDRAGDKGSSAAVTSYATAYAAAVTASTTDGKSNDYYKDALSALESADAALTASVADYANLKGAIEAVTYKVIDPEYGNLESAVKDAQKTYDEGSAEDCATTIAGLDAAVKDAKVADYIYVDKYFKPSVTLGNWIAEGPTGQKNEQHWNGKNDETSWYLEQSSDAWGWAAWSISYSQDVTLPAGDYVFKVAGRKASGNDCTLQLVVTNKATNEALGSVNDFPEGGEGLGITTSGVTSFSSTDTFANGGKGYGFEWRYVKFTLTEDATVTIAVSAEAWKNQQWVSFCNATVQTNNEANIAMIAYNIALNDANLALANDQYKHVTGSEKTTLATAVDADMTGKSKAEIEAATAALQDATAAFKAAAPAYDEYAAVLSMADVDLPYASAQTKADFATAKAATPTTAAECPTAAANLLSALRAYYESNALAEGYDGAKDVTEWIQNPLFADVLNYWTSSQSGGNLGALSSESPTFSDGSTPAYYDYYNSDSNTQHGSQVITNMAPGKYLLTITARADANLNNVFVKIGDQQVAIQKIGATGGVYGRGWNDYSVEYTNAKMQDVTIEVYSTNEGGKKGGWFGFTNVRLVQLQAGAQMSINATAQYGTFIAPFNVEIPAGVEAYTCPSVYGSALELDGLIKTIPANKPVIVYCEEGFEQTFYGKSTATEDSYASGMLTGVYSATKAPVGSYVLMLSDDKAVFGAVVADHQPTVGANRCYLTLPEGSSSNVYTISRGTTHVDNALIDTEDAVIYDITGRRVEKATKGIYIINGKKVFVK